jgi:hypothetical protein
VRQVSQQLTATALRAEWGREEIRGKSEAETPAQNGSLKSHSPDRASGSGW